MIAVVISLSKWKSDPAPAAASPEISATATPDASKNPSPSPSVDDVNLLAARFLTKDLQVGAKDDEVKVLQAKLVVLGLWTPPLTDVFSDTLALKIKDWQKAVNLPETGQISKAERDLLNGAAKSGQNGKDGQNGANGKDGTTTVITKTVTDTAAVDALNKKIEDQQKEIDSLKNQPSPSPIYIYPSSSPSPSPSNPPAGNVTVLIEDVTKSTDQGITWLNVLGSASGLQSGRTYKFIVEMNGTRQSVWYDWSVSGMNGYTVQYPGYASDVRIIIKDVSSNTEYCSLSMRVS